MWKSKFYGAFVLNHRVVLHAIEPASRRRRGTRRELLISAQVAWCKRCDLEISRLFPKTLKDKFNWAMGVEGDWRFEAAEVKKN